MDVNFNVIRIGVKRKNRVLEENLIQNTYLLKKKIRNYLGGIEIGEIKGADIDLCVPSKGNKITIVLQNIRNQQIKNLLKNQYKEYLYKGSYKAISENINNRVFR